MSPTCLESENAPTCLCCLEVGAYTGGEGNEYGSAIRISDTAAMCRWGPASDLGQVTHAYVHPHKHSAENLERLSGPRHEALSRVNGLSPAAIKEVTGKRIQGNTSLIEEYFHIPGPGGTSDGVPIQPPPGVCGMKYAGWSSHDVLVISEGSTPVAFRELQAMSRKYNRVDRAYPLVMGKSTNISLTMFLARLNESKDKDGKPCPWESATEFGKLLAGAQISHLDESVRKVLRGSEPNVHAFVQESQYFNLTRKICRILGLMYIPATGRYIGKFLPKGLWFVYTKLMMCPHGPFGHQCRGMPPTLDPEKDIDVELANDADERTPLKKAVAIAVQRFHNFQGNVQ